MNKRAIKTIDPKSRQIDAGMVGRMFIGSEESKTRSRGEFYRVLKELGEHEGDLLIKKAMDIASKLNRTEFAAGLKEMLDERQGERKRFVGGVLRDGEIDALGVPA